MPQTAFAYLATHDLLVLATASSAGVPHAAPVFYVSDDATVYFSTADNTASGKNLAENAFASIAVADDPNRDGDWSDARGVQISGPVTRLEGADAEAAAAKFGARYSHINDPSAEAPYYRLDASEVHYVHNDEAGDEDFVALGRHWTRETIS